MFKSARWRSDKNKITAVFKLRFHATQVLPFGSSGLVLSLVSADTGKPTAKLEKSEIRGDCCYWESPIFETVKFSQDPKNGKIHERIYFFIISTGSSKSSVLGEVSVNISEYAEATESASISLPFKNSSSDAVLHVLIQRIQENVNQRELEEPEVVKTKPEDRSLKRRFGEGDLEENINTDCNEEKSMRKTMFNTSELNGSGRASTGSDITSTGSDNSSVLNTPREHGMRNNDMVLDAKDASNARKQQGAGWNWSLAATLDSSAEGSTNSQSDVSQDGRSQFATDESVEKLKSDVMLLSRKADIADLELQILRKQVARESRRGQDLLKEVACLKEERDAFKDECEKLKASKKHNEFKARNNLNYEGNPWALLEEAKQELNHEKELNSNLRLQLQKTQESNSELILAVQDLEQMLEEGNGGDFGSSTKPVPSEVSQKLEGKTREVHGQSSDDDEQKESEKLVRQHSDAKDAYMLEQKVMDLCNEIEMYRRDKDELEMQMEQLALDYEILKQENHDMSYKLEQSHLHQQLKLQYECSGSYATINELESEVEKLERELENRSNEFENSLSIIKGLENHTQSLEDELEKRAQEFKAELEVLFNAKVQKEQQAMQAEEALKSARRELENQIEILEIELKKQCQGFAGALANIESLEGRIRILEEELVKQSQGFESDLEAITRAKVEQEQRAIRAEEAVRLTRWKNANMAGRLQDEFKRLSTQMQSSFEANEKVATKAMTDASQLRLMNNHLEELLQQARDELQSVAKDYEAQVSDLRKRLSLKSKQMGQMLAEAEDKSNKFDAQKQHEDEVCQSLSAELQVLRAEVDQLTSETTAVKTKIELAKDMKSELEQVKALVKERDLLVQSGRREIESLESELDSARKEVEKSAEELNSIKCMKEENDTALRNLQSEMDTLRDQCEELRSSLLEEELDKEKLRKQIVQLKADLKKKDDALINMERKLRDNNGRAIAADRTRSSPKNSKFEVASRGSKEVASLKEKIRLLEGQIKQKEVSMESSSNAFLEKENDLHNKIVELERRLEGHNQEQLKQKEIDMETSINAFLEKEKELHGKIEELERRLEENQNNMVIHGEHCKEVDIDTGEFMSNGDKTSLNSCSKLAYGTPSCFSSALESGVSSATTFPSLGMGNGDENNLDALLKEMTSLRENNSAMETELKELQERYSAISLRFAEVEGERQQLVMTLRNVKNAKKS